MTEKEFCPGSLIKRVGSSGPIYVLGNKEEYHDFMMYRLTPKHDPNENYNTSWDIKWLLKDDIIRDYEVVEHLSHRLEIVLDNTVDEEFKDVTTVQESKKLINAGIDAKTADCYHWYSEGKYYTYREVGNNENCIPAWSKEKLVSIILNLINKDTY